MKKDKHAVNFSLFRIKTEQFAVFNHQHTSHKETALNTELQFKLDHINQAIAAFVSFDFAQGKKVFLKIQVSCHFTIEPSTWANLFDAKTEQLTVPQEFLTHIATITADTSRGILFAKTESTPYATFMIPTLDIEAMVIEDAVFDLGTDD